MSDPSPFERHAADVASSRASGDPTAIKHSYRDLGTYLHDHYASGVDAPPQLSWPETTPVVSGAVPPQAARVLDAGCGPNPAICLALARPGRALVAVDIGWGTVDLARRVARLSGAELHGVVADVEHLPFRGEAFDAVLCDDTIEHVPDDRAAVSELARCVAPGGVVVVATPNRQRLDVLFRRAKDSLRFRWRQPSDYFATTSHLREYTPAELSRLLSGSLIVERHLAVGWPPDSIRHRLATALVGGAGRRFGRAVVAVAVPRPES